jgi:plastocyanin
MGGGGRRRGARGLAALGGAGVLLLLAPLVARPAEAGRGRLAGKIALTHGGALKPDASGVIVYVVGFSEPPPTVIAEMAQKDKAFVPGLLAITAGQSVSFPNRDPFFHNVFSLSPPRPFDLGQYTSKSAKVRAFPNPGVVEIYCNIHPEMAATILVLPNRRFARTAADGSFAIEDVPAGAWSAFAFDPYADKPARADVTVRAGEASEPPFAALDETRAPEHLNKFGEKYKDAKGTYGR